MKEPTRPFCSKCGAFTYDLYIFDDKPLCGECAYGEDSEFVEECEKDTHAPCPLCGCKGAK